MALTHVYDKMLRKVRDLDIDQTDVNLTGGTISGVTFTENFTTSTDPALNAAVSTANVDAYNGVLITLTGAGNDQTLQDPTDVAAIKYYTVVNNDTSTDPINIISNSGTHVLAVGQAETFAWDGSVWGQVDVGIDKIPVKIVQGGTGASTASGARTNLDVIQDANDVIKDAHVDWGTGADQVSAVDVPIADAGGIITGTEVEGALQENRTAIDLNTAKTGVTTEIKNLVEDLTPQLGGDLDGNAKYINNSPTISNLSSHGAGYKLDGTNDIITLGNIGNVRSVLISVYLSQVTDIVELFEGASAVKELTITSGSLSYPDFDNAYVDGVDTDTITTGNHIIALTSSTDVDMSAWVVGKYDIGYGEFEVNKVWGFNRELTATEIKDLYSNANLDYSDIGASQTEIVTGDDYDFDTAGNWITSGDATLNIVGDFAGGGGSGVGQFIYLESYSEYGRLPTILTIGKNYRATATMKSASGTFKVLMGNANTTEWTANGTTVSDTGAASYTYDFTATSADFNLYVYNVAGTLYVDNMSVVQIGAVANYDQSGISDTTWYNQSGNGNDATNSGATVINVPEHTVVKNLQSTASITRNTTTVNAATYDLLATDDILLVTYTATATVTSLTLPTAQAVDGRTIIIKDAGGNAGTNNITIDTEAAQTIDGAATLVLNGNYDSVTLVCDGTNWLII